MDPHRHSALVIEDHPDACEALEMLIQANGFDVAAVRTGAEALARLRGGLRCCLVLLDWWLPDMTGEELVRALAADPALKDIPVVMCSGDARIRARATALPVRGVYLKPLDVDQLLDLLHRHCRRGTPDGSQNVA